MSTSKAIRDAVRERMDSRGVLVHTVEELQKLVQEGLASGASGRATMDEIKAEARRRLQAKSLCRAGVQPEPQQGSFLHLMK